MSDGAYRGILCIGDPHLCTWSPGYRKDDYPRATLTKLRWALEHARDNQLLPVLLGDLFHVPRDNANWLIGQLMALLDGKVCAIIGNHDLSEDVLSDHDSLHVLLAAGRLRRLDSNPWIGTINGVPVALGGTNNGQKLPKTIDRAALGEPRWVFWIVHHDIQFPGYEDAGHLDCREVPGVDLMINGHIHRNLPDVTCGSTSWCNPGNISRVSRSDATRLHKPCVLRIDVSGDEYTRTRLDVPHRPFEEVFHPVTQAAGPQDGASSFITGLQSMQKFKTSDGEGLCRLIEANLPRLSNERVRQEIVNLLKEVLPNARTPEPRAGDRAVTETI
ncbi:MAG TPA: metallophosphoesterase [Tepidisphaeraceae bacterium]|nr:metallophosphoesterase [Tepidisphaeraceae bacterium]